MNKQTVIQKYWWNLIIGTIFMFMIQASSQELKLVGDSELAIFPEDAQKVCESLNGNLAVLTDENREFFEEQLFRNCTPHSDFCPKMCVFENSSDNQLEELKIPNGVIMTQPVHLGDTLNLKLKMENKTMEVFQLSNAIIEDMEKGSEQQVFLELSIYNRYVDKSKAINHTKAHKVNVGYGELTISEKWERSKHLVKPHRLDIDQSGDPTIDLKLE